MREKNEHMYKWNLYERPQNYVVCVEDERILVTDIVEKVVDLFLYLQEKARIRSRVPGIFS